MDTRSFPLTSVHRKVQQMFRNQDERFAPWTHLGVHVIAEFIDCRHMPQDIPTMRRQMEQAAERIGCTIVQSVFHAFNPWGLSGVVVVAESHLAIHTWPEHNFACVDLFTCSEELHPRPGFEFLKEAFGAQELDYIELPRGAGLSFAVPAEATA